MKKVLATAGVVIAMSGLVAGCGSNPLDPPQPPPVPKVTQAQNKSMTSELMKVRESTVQVSGFGLGTGSPSWQTETVNGFLISPSLVIVDSPQDAGNVGRAVTITLSNGRAVDGKVIMGSMLDNIGLVQLSSPVTDVPYLRFAKTDPAPGSMVMEVGSPQNGESTWREAGMSIDNYDHPWLGRVLGYTNRAAYGATLTPANTEKMMLATIVATGSHLGDVVVNAEGQVVGVVDWTEVPAGEFGQLLLNPSPYTVKEAMDVVPAIGPWNLEQTVQKAVNGLKL